MIGYHFTNEKLRDGRQIPPVGVWLLHDGPVVPCKSGLHASEHLYEAIEYASGCRLHRVELEGDLVSYGDPIDKWVGRRRKILASIDATALLQEFARWCALRVIDLWDAPAIVRDYLTMGDESLREAARDAVVATVAVVCADPWDSAQAARYASLVAVGATAWDSVHAARYASWAAAGAAAGAAAREAAVAAGNAAVAAGNAAQDAQRVKFADMVTAIMPAISAAMADGV